MNPVITLEAPDPCLPHAMDGEDPKGKYLNSGGKQKYIKNTTLSIAVCTSSPSYRSLAEEGGSLEGEV